MYTCYIQCLRILASFCSWAGWFESYLVKISEDTFSRDVAQMIFFDRILTYIFIATIEAQEFINISIYYKHDKWKVQDEIPPIREMKLAVKSPM